MGERGPLPATATVHHLRGNPGHRAPAQPPTPAPRPPEPPTWLDREGKAEWRRIVPELVKLGLVAKVDRAVLATYCDAWSRFVEARKHLGDGLVVKYRDDRGPTKNPAWQIYRDAAHLVNQLGERLGVSPRARLRMTSTAAKGQDDDDGAGILD